MTEELTFPRIQKGLQCPDCNDRLFSNSVHDFVRCRCERLFIDGGFDCTSYGGHAAPRAIPIERQLERMPPPYSVQERKRQ